MRAILSSLVVPLAIAGAATSLVFPFIGWANAPGYSPVEQYISELGADDSPVAGWINAFAFPVTGILLSLVCFVAWALLPKTARAGFAIFGLFAFAAGYIAAAIYPCEAGCPATGGGLRQTLHNVFGLAGYLLAPPATFLLISVAKAQNMPRAANWFRLSAVTASIGLVWLLMGGGQVGIAQRVLEFGVMPAFLTLAWMARKWSAPRT